MTRFPPASGPALSTLTDSGDPFHLPISPALAHLSSAWTNDLVTGFIHRGHFSATWTSHDPSELWSPNRPSRLKTFPLPCLFLVYLCLPSRGLVCFYILFVFSLCLVVLVFVFYFLCFCFCFSCSFLLFACACISVCLCGFALCVVLAFSFALCWRVFLLCWVYVFRPVRFVFYLFSFFIVLFGCFVWLLLLWCPFFCSLLFSSVGFFPYPPVFCVALLCSLLCLRGVCRLSSMLVFFIFGSVVFFSPVLFLFAFFAMLCFLLLSLFLFLFWLLSQLFIFFLRYVIF